MQAIHLAGIDYLILIAYVAFVIGIGWMLVDSLATKSQKTDEVVQFDHAILLGTNINLVWGIILPVFGVLMLLGTIGGKKNPPAK
jgi:hypothetical protein